jgi:excisionase family DNA binding protein
MPAQPTRQLLTIVGAADYIGVCPRTVRNYIAAGRLVGYRLGPHAIRIDVADLDAMLSPIPATQ